MLLLFTTTSGNISGWWVPVCLIAGLLYAWLLYRRQTNLNKLWRNILFVLRTIAVSFIAYLLAAPLVKSTSYKPQKPLVLIAQDNSSSIALFKKQDFDTHHFIGDLHKLKQQLGDDYDVREFHFDKSLRDSLAEKFNGNKTDISGALRQLNDRFVNQNIGAVVLATDGLYNQGADPLYEAKNLRTSIYTIALGDTVARRDLLIGNISYNKTAFLGNDFMVEVLTQAYQSKGENTRIIITEDGRQIISQNIGITTNDFKKTLPVKLTADKKGIHKFAVSIAPVSNEVSLQNNTEIFYVEVIDAKQKILLLYDGPHPDISVLKQGIESNRNYTVKTTQPTGLTNIKPADYNLIILYQLVPPPALSAFLAKNKTPVWYIEGSQTNVGAINQAQKVLAVNMARQDMQEVFARPGNDFTLFTLSDSSRNKLPHLPPLLAPYGTYNAATGSQILLRQTIGQVATSYPLLAFGEDNGRRTAVLAGEGIWRWQLGEFQQYGNHHAVEELLGQSVQYLTANADKQRFRVYPAKNVFDEGENVLLNAELYNDALELVNMPDVKIDLKGSKGKSYSFLFSRTDKSYQLNAGALPADEYGYTATTSMGKQQFKASGQLTVKALNLEARQTAANYQLLRQLAAQSGGKMVDYGHISSLADMIRHNDNIKTVVYEDKRYTDLVDVKWVFLLIVLLLSAEWLLRKREGVV